MSTIRALEPATIATVGFGPKPGPVTGDIAQFSASRTGEFRIAASLSPAQRAQGLHLNRVNAVLTGNCHFGGWWDVVPKDTDMVIVQSSAFRGRYVQVGYQTLQDAAVVYAKRAAGIRRNVALDIPGQAGEKVRVLYVRVNEDSTFTPSADGRGVTVSARGQSAFVGGDAFRRDVKLKLVASPSERSLPSSEKFEFYLSDPYGWGRQGDLGLELGGGAKEEDAVAKKVEPMFAPRS